MEVLTGVKVFKDCEEGNELLHFHELFRAKAMPFSPKLEDLLVERVGDRFRYKGPAKLIAKMPVGDSDDLPRIQLQTVSLTLIGMLFLIYEIIRKSSEKV